MTTRQYARLMADWIAGIGLNPHLFGTHSLRHTKATLIYRRTGNLRAVRLLLGHTNMESTVRYLGIEVDDAHLVGAGEAVGGISKPRAFAVLRLITSSNLVACSIGFSAGFGPRKILLTKVGGSPEQVGHVWSVGN
jgi:hypothetical protein